MLLTVDANGNDATQDTFDPETIVQYGFEPQRDDMRGLGASWGAGTAGRGRLADGHRYPKPGRRMALVLRRRSSPTISRGRSYVREH